MQICPLCAFFIEISTETFHPHSTVKNFAMVHMVPGMTSRSYFTIILCNFWSFELPGLFFRPLSWILRERSIITWVFSLASDQSATRSVVRGQMSWGRQANVGVLESTTRIWAGALWTDTVLHELSGSFLHCFIIIGHSSIVLPHISATSAPGCVYRD